MSEIQVIVVGAIGSGKSAILGEIEIALKAIGIPVKYFDDKKAQQEKNLTRADWASILEDTKPSVVLIENIR